MIEHDETIGTLLKALDDMGIADDTIVVYTTDNGPHMNTWPDGAMTPFRSEKNTNWEGAFRVPCLVRWPGHIKPGTVTNELMSHNDWMPTPAPRSRASPTSSTSCRKGYTANGITYKVHLDGYDQSKFLTTVSGSAANNNGVKSARDTFFYSRRRRPARGDADRATTSTSSRSSARKARWPCGPSPSRRCACRRSSTSCRIRIERADITSNTFWDWQLNHVGSTYGMMDEVFKFVATFKDFPPRSFPPSFNPANIMEETLEDLKTKKMLRESVDPQRVRGTLDEMIKKQIEEQKKQ